jgi:hypothetical protein
MPSRPSEDDFIRYFHRVSGSDPDRRKEARWRHRVRMEAWQPRRTVQKEWYARHGHPFRLSQARLTLPAAVTIPAAAGSRDSDPQ